MRASQTFRGMIETNKKKSFLFSFFSLNERYMKEKIKISLPTGLKRGPLSFGRELPHWDALHILLGNVTR